MQKSVCFLCFNNWFDFDMARRKLGLHSFEMQLIAVIKSTKVHGGNLHFFRTSDVMRLGLEADVVGTSKKITGFK